MNKIKYYLTNDIERKCIATSGMNFARRNYNIKKLLNELLKLE